MKKFCKIKRILSCLILLCLLFSHVVCATVVDTNAPYFGDYLFVYNPTDSTVTLSPTVSSRLSRFVLFDMNNETEVAETDVQIDWTPDYSDLELPNNLQKTLKEESLAAPVLYSANSDVGETYTYVVTNTKTYEAYYQEFICLVVGEYCNILVEFDSNGEPVISVEDAQKMATEFDDNIQPFMVENFGDYFTYLGTDSSGRYVRFSQNDRMDILVYDIQDGYNGTTNPSYVGGYTTAADFIAPLWGGNGNERGILHIDTYPSLGKNGSFDVEKSYSTIVHEFQHQISNSDSLFDWVTGATVDPINDSWWNEAFSLAAEHLYLGEPLDYRINKYNQATNTTPLRSGLVLGYLDYAENNDNVASNYSSVYLFGQYLRCQTKHLAGGGDRIYRTILEQHGTDYTTILAGLSSIGYEYTPETFEELYRNFRMATILKNPTGPYGFAGESAFSGLLDNAYTGTANLKLKPGAAAVLVRPENFTPTNTRLSYVSFSDRGVFTYDVNAVSDTVVNVTHGSYPQSGIRLLAAGYDGEMKLIGTDEIPVLENQENYTYSLPENSIFKKFFLWTKDGSLKPLSETR